MLDELFRPRRKGAAIEPELREMGELTGGELYEMQLANRHHEPILTQWDTWRERFDQIEVLPLWSADLTSR